MYVANADVQERLLQVFNSVFHLELPPSAWKVNEVDVWDSLSHIKLMMYLEREFHIRIPTAQIQSLYKDFATVLAHITSATNACRERAAHDRPL